jgi:type II secretory pathway component PulF
MVLPLTSAADYILKGPKAYFNEAFMPMIYVGLIVLAIYMFCRYAFRFKPFRYAYDTVKAFLPTFGWTVRLMAFSKFTRALSALYTAGVFIPTALSISGRVCGNQFIRSNVDTVVSSVKAGEKISTGMRKTRQFPPLMVSMLETAEESGNMSELLDKVTQYYDSEAKMRLHTTCITLGILATVVVGIIVGIKVVEFYSGYFNALLSM